MLIPDLPSTRDGNLGADDERREADLWLPDMGEITNENCNCLSMFSSSTFPHDRQDRCQLLLSITYST